jgi:MFS family permease
VTEQPQRSLFRERDFLRLFTAETISELGSQVSLLALPLVAITLLHSSTFEVGALTAVELTPFLLFGLPAGAIVDRLSRRRVLVTCDIGRAILLATIPIAYAFDDLSYTQLLIVVFFTGTMTVFFDVAYQSILPSLVARDRLPDGNAKLEISRSAAQLAGPGVGGLLVQWIRAAAAVSADAISFVLSAIFIFGIRAKEPPVEPIAETESRLRTLAHEIKEGLHYVLGHRVLRLIAGATATSNLFGAMTTAVWLLYAVRELHYSAGAVGLALTLGYLGALAAAITTARITRALKLGPSIVAGMVIACIGTLLLPLAPQSNAWPWFVASYILLNFGSSFYNINQVSMRQAITPDRMLGRMNATMRFMVWGTMPIGSLIGGVLGATIGLRQTLWVGALGSFLAILWLLGKPVREMREMPAPAQA